MSLNEIPLTFRPPTPQDLDFISDSWIKSQRNSDFHNYITNPIYHRYMHSLIANVIKRSLVTVVCDPEDSNHVYGYAVYEFIGDIFVLNFIYLKQPYRKQFNIANRILKTIYPNFGKEDSFITFIDRTFARLEKDFKTGEPVIKYRSWFTRNRVKFKMNYNPFLLVR